MKKITFKSVPGKQTLIIIYALLAGITIFPTAIKAETMDHQAHMMSQQMTGHENMDDVAMQNSIDQSRPLELPTEPGQAAFATIAEIVLILRADPSTDWRKVNIHALRQHLIDMDNVTLRAQVMAEAIDGGARFVVTSSDNKVIESIRRMVMAHTAVMSGVDGIILIPDRHPKGVMLTATGDNPDMIRGLGFIGLMTIGMHHQRHHLAIARGDNPHAH